MKNIVKSIILIIFFLFSSYSYSINTYELNIPKEDSKELAISSRTANTLDYGLKSEIFFNSTIINFKLRNSTFINRCSIEGTYSSAINSIYCNFTKLEIVSIKSQHIGIPILFRKLTI